MIFCVRRLRRRAVLFTRRISCTVNFRTILMSEFSAIRLSALMSELYRETFAIGETVQTSYNVYIMVDNSYCVEMMILRTVAGRNVLFRLWKTQKTTTASIYIIF